MICIIEVCWGKLGDINVKSNGAYRDHFALNGYAGKHPLGILHEAFGLQLKP
jgi:hypothetical protein